MLSHALAALLLKRRNHDLRFVTEVCLPGRDGEAGQFTSIMLHDDYLRDVGREDVSDDVLVYDSENDLLNVSMGPTYAGSQGEYTLSEAEVDLVVLAITKKIWSLDHVGAYPQSDPRRMVYVDLLRRLKEIQQG